MVTNKDRDYYMDRYFEMRLSDYLIHIYTRYGMALAAEQDIID